MLALVLDAVGAVGFETTVVVVPPDATSIRQAFGDGATFVEQPEPLGSGHALLQARDLLNGVDNVVVLYADVPLIRPETISGLLRQHVETDAVITLLTADLERPGSLGRVVRDGSGRLTAVIEVADADEQALAIREVNSGVYCFRAAWLWSNLDRLAPSASGETYLTDLVSRASRQGMKVTSLQATDPREITGVNTRVELSEVEAAMRQRINEGWMLSGVSIVDPASVYIDCDVELGMDTVVQPNTHIRGGSRIGGECQIGPNTIIDGCVVGRACRVVASVLEDSTLGNEVQVGPFSHVRPGSQLGDGVHIGNFAEVKKSRLGRGTKSGHFSYIGDADVGTNVNIGAGTVTCNYDGKEKHRTVIGDDAFIGCDTMLVAPVSVGARSSTGVGAVVNKDVPPDSKAIGVPARIRSGKEGGPR